MPLSGLTDPAAVLAAIAEYDRIGRRDFLERYGFGKAEHYFLVHGRSWYDSKAIAGVAHGIQKPHLGPLRANQFSGGVRGAVGRLRALGFEVINADETRRKASDPIQHYVYYWQRYARDVAGGPIYQLNQDAPAMARLCAGDVVWAISLAQRNHYAVVARFVVSDVGENAPGSAVAAASGHRFFQSAPSDTVYYTVAGQPNCANIVMKLDLSSGENVGQSFQGLAGVKLLPDGGTAFLRHADGLLPDRRLTTAEAVKVAEIEKSEAVLSTEPETPARREIRREALIRNRSIVHKLKAVYGGKCQITGAEPLDGLAGNITEAHHIRWLTRGGLDHIDNMIVVSPDWHAAIHASDATFDWSELSFVIEGKRVPLAINGHLKVKR